MNEVLLPGEPRIMPMQTSAFNGDTFIAEEFLRLKEKYGIINVCETGTATGGTTKWFAENFENVYTIEIKHHFLEFAKLRCKGFTNITFYEGDSPTILSYTLNKLSNRTIYLLDAHWLEMCPLKSELAAIANAGLRPIIAIHDFQVPGEPLLGFDSYNGQPFTFEWIKPSLDAIYNEKDLEGKNIGPDDYEYYYNSYENSGGARRGIIFITPK